LLPWKIHIRSSIQKKLGSKWYFLDPSIPAAALSLTNARLKNDLNALGFYFESLAIRDIRIYADYIGAEAFYFQDSKGLDIDMIVELPDESWSAFEIKLGGEKGIAEAVRNFKSLQGKLDSKKWAKLITLNIIIAGNVSYTRPDGINIISLGHLFAK
jgi:catechol-2,3-dioxygenase